VAPVPENGNCTATLAHLDPFVRGEDPVCDKALPQTCQTGDLSGKWGNIEAGNDTFSLQAEDLFSSTLEGLGSFFGNRSIVFHYANKTRVSCANFEKVAGDAGAGGASESACSSTGIAHPTGHANLTAPHTPSSPTSSGTAPSSPPRSAGSNLQASAASVIALAAAIMFML